MLLLLKVHVEPSHKTASDWLGRGGGSIHPRVSAAGRIQLDCGWIMEIRQESGALIRNLLVLVMKRAVEDKNDQARVNGVEKLERLFKVPLLDGDGATFFTPNCRLMSFIVESLDWTQHRRRDLFFLVRLPGFLPIFLILLCRQWQGTRDQEEP